MSSPFRTSFLSGRVSKGKGGGGRWRVGYGWRRSHRRENDLKEGEKVTKMPLCYTSGLQDRTRAGFSVPGKRGFAVERGLPLLTPSPPLAITLNPYTSPFKWTPPCPPPLTPSVSHGHRWAMTSSPFPDIRCVINRFFLKQLYRWLCADKFLNNMNNKQIINHSCCNSGIHVISIICSADLGSLKSNTLNSE